MLKKSLIIFLVALIAFAIALPGCCGERARESFEESLMEAMEEAVDTLEAAIEEVADTLGETIEEIEEEIEEGGTTPSTE